MRLGQGFSLSGILMVVLLAWFVYSVFIPRAGPCYNVRKCAMNILNTLEPICVNIGDIFSVEEYRVKRLVHTFRSNLYQTPGNTSVEVRQIAVNGRPALHYCPEGDYSKQMLPAIIYFHGGSWISGSAAESSPLTTFLCNSSKSIVIAIDYRLSPEHKFPTAFEDCLKSTQAILKAPEQYGIANGKIALAGDDVGGNLALAVALNISKEGDNDSGDSEIRLVGMFYPTLQAFDFTLPSYTRYASTNDITTIDVIKGVVYYLFGKRDDLVTSSMSTSGHLTKDLEKSKFYKSVFDSYLLPYSFRQWQTEVNQCRLTNRSLEQELGSLILDARFSAILAPKENLALLPYTYFISPERDPKRDDSFLVYARLLDINSSKTEHIYYSSEAHGFLMDVDDNEIARCALDRFVDYFQKVLNSSR